MRLDWVVTEWDAFVARLASVRVDHGGPAVIAINGHSSSGKTTLATRLGTALPSAGLLQTDDLARPEGVFAWDEPLLDEVLPVVRAHEPLDQPPPAWWQARGRTGSVTLPGSLAYLVLEGVGASQASVRAELDLVVWVETEEPTRLARDEVRVAAGEMSPEDYRGWMAAEDAYVVAEQPWRHADLVVYGGESIPYARGTQLLVSG